MPTSVHIPKPLLGAVDKKAKALGISRNRLIVRALEREVTPGLDWSPGFVQRLLDVDEATVGAVDDMLEDIRANRRTKKPVDL